MTIGLIAGWIILNMTLPIATHYWYIGHRSQWVIVIDSQGLTVGPDASPTNLGTFPLAVGELLFVAFVGWLIGRIFGRHRTMKIPAGL